MNIDTINYCKNEDNKNRINNRLRSLLTNPNYRINNDTTQKINDILHLLDHYTCRELLEQNINFKKIYDLFSQFLENSNVDEIPIENNQRKRVLDFDFDLNNEFDAMGIQNENKNNQLLIDRINELHKLLFSEDLLEESFKKVKIGGFRHKSSKNKSKKNKSKKNKSKKTNLKKTNLKRIYYNYFIK
jgi:hypothetical protein